MILPLCPENHIAKFLKQRDERSEVGADVAESLVHALKATKCHISGGSDVIRSGCIDPSSERMAGIIDIANVCVTIIHGTDIEKDVEEGFQVVLFRVLYSRLPHKELDRHERQRSLYVININ
jgi:hypothetical protein